MSKVKINITKKYTQDLGQSQDKYQGNTENVIYRIEANTKNGSWQTVAELIVYRATVYGQRKMNYEQAFLTVVERDENGDRIGWSDYTKIKADSLAQAKKFARNFLLESM